MKLHLNLYVFLIISLSAFGQTNVDLQTKLDTFKYFSISDVNFNKYELPDNFKKPENWKQADKERKGIMGDFFGNSYSKKFDLKKALEIIDSATQFSEIRSAKSWCINNYSKAFPYLVARLSDKRKIGLENTADLIIWDRIQTGDLKFDGHGGGIDEDIFTVAGRASWILNQLTGENFAVVHGNLTEEQSEDFKLKWLKYLEKLKL